MYVRDTDPLPRNSMDPVTPCEAAAAREVVQGVETAVQNARSASAMIAGPDSFRQFGPALVADVKRSQNEMSTRAQAPTPASVQQQAELIAAPEVVPLNVSPTEYGACLVKRPTPVLAHAQRGMGALWGDAGSVPSGPGWDKASGGVSMKTLGFLALAALGLWAMARKDQR